MPERIRRSLVYSLKSFLVKMKGYVYNSMSRVCYDIETIIAKKELFSTLSHSTVLVTGATGLIGSMLMRAISAADKKYDLRIKLVGQIRNEDKARVLFGELYEEMKFVLEDDGEYNYIIHTVSPTTSKYFIEHPVETIKTSVCSAMSMLETAKDSGASVVYLSSMEQYGIPYKTNETMTEDKVGIIDHLSIRSSYSESKRLCECICASYAAEYGVDVKIARLAQTFGAGVPLSDNRMPMQFARAVVENKDIILYTEGKSISNFVYLTDAVTGILTILVKGRSGEAYNVCNDKETRSVYDIAHLVADNVAGGQIDVLIKKKENMGYAPDVAMYLNSGKLRDLGWNAEVDMLKAYRNLVEYIKDN